MLHTEHFSFVLALETEFLDEGVVSLLILILEILQVLTAIRNHLKETTARVKILLVLTQVR